MPRFMDFHENLKLPAEAIAQIADWALPNATARIEAGFIMPNLDFFPAEHAIRPGASGPLVVLGELCTDCGECVEVCPADAIEMVP